MPTWLAIKAKRLSVVVGRRGTDLPVRVMAASFLLVVASMVSALFLTGVAPAMSAEPVFLSQPSTGVLPDFEAVRAAHRPSHLSVRDRHGEPVAVLRMDYTGRRGEWLPLRAIAPALHRAVMQSEDQRFHEHAGVDWTAVAAAGWNWLFGDGRRGASTISMQLAAMLDDTLQRPGGGRSLRQKVQQARQAMRLESSWSKEQILEAYLNLAAFRGELIGVDALSRVMFGKYAHGLDEREAAVAAALLRGPNASVDRVAARACMLLAETRGAAACDGLRPRLTRWLATTARAAADMPALAPHFARAAAARQGVQEGGVLRTTLDADLQREVLQSVEQHLAGMGQAQLTDAAVVVLDNRTAEVLAYVGAAAATSSAGQVDHARARRQTGSTLKPFLYALALEARYLTAASLLNDAPLDVATAGGLYIPQNYDLGYAGPVSVRTALASSLNIPAVRALMLVGPERFADRLRRLGLPLEHESDHYGYSLALGSADADLFSLTNAYRIMADGGRWREPAMSKDGMSESGNGPQVVDPLAAWLVGDILADRGARARTFGLENALVTPFWSAVKTGTSKDMRDNWALGWSERYTVGVWVGNSAGLSMRDVSGVSGAAPIWNDVMRFLHRRYDSRQPPRPAALASSRVEFAGGLEASRTEYFLPGTVLTHVAPLPARGAGRARITTPASGTIFAMDPDMPMISQRLPLRSNRGITASDPVRWRVNGVEVARGTDVYWQPYPGRHRIVLEDASGVVLDQASIEVRGAPRTIGRRSAGSR